MNKIDKMDYENARMFANGMTRQIEEALKDIFIVKEKLEAILRANRKVLNFLIDIEVISNE